jgi:hypothetical protein
MDVDAEALKEEVRLLCRRLAARNPSLWLRVGPQLRRISGITEQDTPGQIRSKLAKAIERSMADHTEEMETLQTALGLHPLAAQYALDRRLDSLAKRRHLALRTMHRRLDEAIDLFVRTAQAAARDSSAAGDLGYIVDNFDSTFAVVGERARIVERRKIRSTREDLRVVRCLLGVPRPPQGEDEPGFTVELVHGGLHCIVHREGGAVACDIELREPLDEGQMHEFEIAYEVPSSLLGPFYVVQPATPFGTVSMVVRFDPRRVPTRVWQVEGAMPSDVEGRTCTADGPALAPDPSAQVRATFHKVREGRCYGVAWTQR